MELKHFFREQVQEILLSLQYVYFAITLHKLSYSLQKFEAFYRKV